MLRLFDAAGSRVWSGEGPTDGKHRSPANHVDNMFVDARHYLGGILGNAANVFSVLSYSPPDIPPLPHIPGKVETAFQKHTYNPAT